MIISAFTKKYNQIEKKLINSAVVENNNNSSFTPVVAQWDTWATGTCISKELVQKLNLIPTGMVRVQTPSGQGRMNKYLVNIILNNEVRIINLPVMDSEIGKHSNIVESQWALAFQSYSPLFSPKTNFQTLQINLPIFPTHTISLSAKTIPKAVPSETALSKIPHND